MNTKKYYNITKVSFKLSPKELNCRRRKFFFSPPHRSPYMVMHYVLICFIASLSDFFLHKYSTHKYECVWMKILFRREIQITIFSELQNVTKNKKRRVSFHVSERNITFRKTCKKILN